MTRALAATLAIPLFFLAACSPAERTNGTATDTPGATDADANLDQIARRYEQAVRAGDREALERLHTGDAWISLAGGQSGRPAEVLAQTAADLTLETRRTQTAGEWAYATGTWRQQVTGADGVLRRLDGHYLTVFRRENGEWRIRELVTNMSEESQQAMAQMQRTAPMQQTSPAQETPPNP